MHQTYLLKNAKIVAPNQPLNGKTTDLLIEDGKIKSIGDLTNDKAEIIDLKGACVSPGWLDIGTQIGDPGFEHKEDLESVAAAAKAGGFTALASYPNTLPVVHSKTEVLYVRNNSRQNLVEFHPVGAVSHNCEGKEITEMYDMRKAGAVAFSDGIHSIQDSGMMMRSLLYVKPFDGVIINHPCNKGVAAGGSIHEGTASTNLGLRGIPRIAEDLMVQRDLYLSEYTESRLHLANISSARSVELIRQAKQKGFQVTASVNPMNLIFEDSQLLSFDTNLKVLPPIREVSDADALKAGLKDGTIDVINSNHSPHDKEAKELEFVYADYGVLGLETAYASINTFLGELLSQEEIVAKLAINPRTILGLPVPEIKEGAVANMTIFNPKEEWTFAQQDIHSKSKNTPFIGQKFTGRVLGVLNNGSLEFRNSIK